MPSSSLTRSERSVDGLVHVVVLVLAQPTRRKHHVAFALGQLRDTARRAPGVALVVDGIVRLHRPVLPGLRGIRCVMTVFSWIAELKMLVLDDARERNLAFGVVDHRIALASSLNRPTSVSKRNAAILEIAQLVIEILVDRAGSR